MVSAYLNITEDNIMDKQFLSAHYDRFCCTNIELIHGDIRGIILYFNGLGHIVNPGPDMIDAPAAAARNILYITPCYNPWSWMNRDTVAFCDMLVEIAMEKWSIPTDAPVGLYGGSMGGYSVFHFAMQSKHNIVAGDLNCPCCNLEYEVLCNKNSILHTLFEATMGYCDDFTAFLHDNSPVNMVGRLKRIPYRFAVGMQDGVLAPSQHSMKLIPLLREAGYTVDVAEYPHAGHCNIGAEARAAEHAWLMDRMFED